MGVETGVDEVRPLNSAARDDTAESGIQQQQRNDEEGLEGRDARDSDRPDVLGSSGNDTTDEPNKQDPSTGGDGDGADNGAGDDTTHQPRNHPSPPSNPTPNNGSGISGISAGDTNTDTKLPQDDHDNTEELVEGQEDDLIY